MAVEIGCIIQARMGSTRLPGKVMQNVTEKKPLIHFLLDQLKGSSQIEKIVVATTTLPEDNIIFDYIENLGVDCFRGNPFDVLNRYYECAKKFSFSNIVRITSDNPLIDPKIVDSVITKFKTGSFDYVANCIERTFPYGTETEVFSFRALESASKNAHSDNDKEHVTPYFRNNQKFRTFDLKYFKDISKLRWTVDTKSDLEFVKKIISKIHTRPILLDDILNLLQNDSELLKINSSKL
ncbi:MAG: glycosyltransferase family protein [Nitrosopumilus sp.]|uniref:glycosyltransferase family protein n=1 Tax=Nitrosopumilus sp. TaxID=2024843 RepID=UPI00247EAA56|nr:glycosyltransferase family protein [Nitrosopumilus sp.]MCV0393556.1 glycosyltransferase family protein [Nitrosopumilus sp.]